MEILKNEISLQPMSAQVVYQPNMKCQQFLEQNRILNRYQEADSCRECLFVDISVAKKIIKNFFNHF